MSVKTEDGPEFLLSTAREMGIACSTVSDGHVLIFTKKHLEHLMKSIGDSNEIIVFVKRPDFKD